MKVVCGPKEVLLRGHFNMPPILVNFAKLGFINMSVMQHESIARADSAIIGKRIHKMMSKLRRPESQKKCSAHKKFWNSQLPQCYSAHKSKRCR